MPSNSLEIVFSFAVWTLWSHRNQVVFNSKTPNPSLAKEIVHRATEFFYYAYFPKIASQLVAKQIRWEKPRRGWVKLNTDGSSLGNPGLVGGGGLIRDKDGAWVVGFARNIGISSSFIAKLWALRDRLLICVHRNFNAVEVELDAKAVIDVLSASKSTNSLVAPLVDDCRQLATQIHQIHSKHCFREANRSANKLARMGAAQDSQFKLFLCPPVDLVTVFNSDLNGLYLTRMCTESSFVL